MTPVKATQPAEDVKVGEVVMCWDIRSQVVHVSGKKVRIRILDGGAVGMTVMAMPELLKRID